MELNKRNAANETPATAEQSAAKETGTNLRLDPTVREDQILQVAIKHFASRGVLASSMKAIAEDAGITRALLYHYFPGKESLAAAVTRREARIVLATLSEQGIDDAEAIRETVEAYFARVAGTPGHNPDMPNTPEAFISWLIESSGMTVNERTRVVLTGWMCMVDYFAQYVAQGEHNNRRSMRTDEAIDICIGAVTSMTSGF